MLQETMKQVKRAHTLHARTSSRKTDGTTTTPRAAWRREIKPVLFAASLTALLARVLAIAGFQKKPNGDWVARESVFVERLLSPANHPEHMSPMSTVHAFPSPDEAAVNMRDPSRRAMLPHIPPEWNPGASCKYEVKALYVEQMIALSRDAAVMETGAVDYDEKMSALEHIMGYSSLVVANDHPFVVSLTELPAGIAQVDIVFSYESTGRILPTQPFIPIVAI
jgi:hypothetical protein